MKETLKTLCLTSGVSGAEHPVSEKAAALLAPYAQTVSIDPFGNVIAVIRSAEAGAPTVLWEAHLDEIGLTVTHIDENGFLKVAACGGVDRRLLLAQSVTVWGTEPIKGVICSTPPHLETEEERKKTPEIEKIAIDIGMNEKAARAVVRPGDKITFDSEWNELLDGRISVKALDDRAGVAAILSALDRLGDASLSCGLTVLLSAQEELGERGAAIGGFRIAPDLCLCVDVSFAHTPDVPRHKCGIIGQGVMIGVAPTLHKTVSDRLIALAQEEKIPYQLEIMGGETSTDADAIGVLGGGVKTGLLSIPLRYMHTPIETASFSDITAVGDLLAAFTRQF